MVDFNRTKKFISTSSAVWSWVGLKSAVETKTFHSNGCNISPGKLMWTYPVFYKQKKKSQQHPEFPSGLPSKYYPGPMLLDFSDRTRTGMFNMVWPLAKYSIKIGTHQQQISETKQLKFLKCVKSDATPAVRLLICT